MDPWTHRLLGRLIAIGVRVLFWTVRCRVEGTEAVDELRQRGHKLVYAFWHGSQFLMLGHHEGRKGVIMVSLSRDGTLQKEVLDHFGYGSVRGSVSRRGRAALKELLRIVSEGEMPAGLAVDGPRGPRHIAKRGIVVLAARAGAYLVPMTAAVRRSWRLGSWDRLEIPWPFTSGWIVYGEPFRVDNDYQAKRQGLEILQRSMDQATRRAEELAGCRR